MSLAFTFHRSDRPFGTYQSLINERGRMMKKLLLGSTALVVGGLMAAPAMAAEAPIRATTSSCSAFWYSGSRLLELGGMNWT